MFFDFFKKNSKQHKTVTILDEIEKKELAWVQGCIETKEDFPRINWKKLVATLESDYQGNDAPELVNNIWRFWLEKLTEKLPAGNQIHESENFILLTSESDKYTNLFLNFLERSHNSILRTLAKVAHSNPYSKFVVIIIDDKDSYYSYISHYYPENGAFAMSGGMFLSEGFGHFVFPHYDLDSAEAVAAHELTHAMLAHLPIPLWLNEGLAVNMEQAITRSPQFRLTKERHYKLQQFWQEKEIQQFWAGTSFSRPDDGNSLSYQLAQLIVISLSENFEEFVKFINKASFSDGGESAAIEVYGGSLGAIIHQFFGDGDWSPRPSEWKDDYS